MINKIRFSFILIQIFLIFTESSFSQVCVILDSIPQNTNDTASVFIAGNFNNWNPADLAYKFEKDTNGHLSLILNTNLKEIEYKFTLGSWESEECALDGKTIQNRESAVIQNDTIHVQIKAWKSGIKNHTASKNVSIVSNNFYIPQLNKTRRIWIYLPPDYKTTTKKYPVFYAHDGQNLFDNATSFAGEWGIDECLDSLYLQGFRTAIVVGVDNGGTSRTDELTPWPNPVYKGGKADLYADFIVKTLKPFIDSNYRTLADVKNTSVLGSSLGGLVSFYMILKYPKVFGKAGVFSPSFWFSDEVYRMAQNFNERKHGRIYIIGGGRESENLENEIMKMKQILLARKFKPNELKVEIIADGQHNEWFWRREFPKVYLWLMNSEKVKK